MLASKYLADGYKSDEFYYTSAENQNPAVPIGTVVIREVKAPDGYSLSNVVFYRNLSDSVIAIMKDTNTPINVPIDEMPAKAYIGIHKLNRSGIGVGGAVYGLYSDSACASLYDKLTTSADGKGTFANR